MPQYKPPTPQLPTTTTPTTTTAPQHEDMRYTFLISLAICATLIAIAIVFSSTRRY